MKNQTLFIVTLVLFSGCTAYPVSTPESYYEDVSTQSGTETLFSGDSDVLSNEEIQKILAFRYKVPSLNRIALLPSGWTSFGSWSEEMTLATQDVEQGTLTTLKSSDYVYDASFLPSILVPKNRTVPYLREAAARFQADLLLVYKSACRSFERYRIFRSAKTRAYCTVEAVLLDVRSGLVPFTASSIQKFETQKTEQDMNTREAVLKAQLQAMSVALNEVAEGVVSFIEQNQNSGT